MCEKARIAALALLVLGVVLYGIKAPGGKEAAGTPACPGAAETAARLKPLVHGEIAALGIASQPRPLPDLSFDTPEGTKASLADSASSRSPMPSSRSAKVSRGTLRFRTVLSVAIN